MNHRNTPVHGLDLTIKLYCARFGTYNCATRFLRGFARDHVRVTKCTLPSDSPLACSPAWLPVSQNSLPVSQLILPILRDTPGNHPVASCRMTQRLRHVTVDKSGCATRHAPTCARERLTFHARSRRHMPVIPSNGLIEASRRFEKLPEHSRMF